MTDVIIHMEMHPGGLSSAHATATVKGTTYDTTRRVGKQEARYTEGSVYKLIRTLIDAGHTGLSFVVISARTGVPVMSGIISPYALPNGWRTKEEREALREEREE